jgi:hypothetical protein
MVDYQIDGIEPDMSFLEMLDVFNEDLSKDSQFHLIMTVAKEFAECVLCTSMEKQRTGGDDLSIAHAYV